MHTPDPPDEDPRVDAILRAAMGPNAPPDPDAEPDDADAIDDGLIRAWQAGRLDDAATAELEGLLADSPEGRAVALASTEPVDEALFEWARQQSPRSASPPAAPRQRPRLMIVALAATVLIGVGVALMLRGGPSAPDYVTAGLEGGAAVVRGADRPEGAVPEYEPTNMLRVKLRPPVAGEAPPVRAFIARPDGPLKAVGVVTRAAPGGALVIETPAGGLFGDATGEWRFYVALGHSDADPAGAPYAPDATPALQWFAFPLVYRLPEGDGR